MTPEPSEGAPASPRLPGPPGPPVPRSQPLRERLGGPWRILVAEASMRPTLEPGDWLLVDPTVRSWPRRGSIVIVQEPDSGWLAVKRVAGRPGDVVPFAGGFLRLGPDEAWLLSDADEATAARAGFGQPVDSRRYGPVPVSHLMARAWFRYGPLARVGPLPHPPRRSPFEETA